MFCDRCGSTVPQDQRFCGRCGKEFAGSISIAYPSPSRLQAHVRLLGILWMAYAALHAVAGLAICIVANTVIPHIQDLGGPPNFPAALLRPLLSVIGSLILLKAALSFCAAWGLPRREPWARMLTIVLAFLALFSVPLGTALGIYTLWVLLPGESQREYEQTAKSASAA